MADNYTPPKDCKMYVKPVAGIHGGFCLYSFASGSYFGIRRKTYAEAVLVADKENCRQQQYEDIRLAYLKKDKK